jgi:hypothetical protein
MQNCAMMNNSDNMIISQNVVTTEIASSKRYFKVSCTNCRSSHRKCDRELPSCNQCIRKGITCCYNPPKKRGRTKSGNTHETTTTTTLPVTQNSETSSIMINNTPQQLLVQQIGSSLEDRINSASWHASSALLFLHTPVVDQQHVRKMCDDVGRQLSIVTPAVNTSDLYGLIQSMSKLELQQNAMKMFNKAKELILHPDIFPQIATNASLAHACSGLALFLLTSKGNNILEALLYNSAVKVFVKQTKSVAESDSIEQISSTALITIENRKEMTQYRESIQIVSMGFYATKLLYFFHTDISKYTMNDLVEIIEFMQKIFKFLLDVFPMEDVQQKQSIYNTCTSIIHIIKECRGLQRIKLMLEAIESIVYEFNTAKVPEIIILAIRGLQLYSVSIELKTITDLGEYLELKSIQLKFANLITMTLTDNYSTSEYNIRSLPDSDHRSLPKLELIAAASKLITLVCNVHMEHCDKLLANPHRDHMELSEALTFLQSDVLFMDKFQKNEPLPIYDEILQKLKMKIMSLIPVIQRAYREKELQQQQQPPASQRQENFLSQLLSVVDNQPVVAPDYITPSSSEIVPHEYYDEDPLNYLEQQQLDIDDLFDF